MVAYYKNNFRNALIDAFPDLKLDEHKFLFLSRMFLIFSFLFLY
jgi:hypothetical protein